MTQFIEVIKAIIVGIIEGITEWLPISSTGHIMLFNSIWPLDVSDDFFDMFKVVIQLGAILAIVVLFFRKLNPFSGKKSVAEKKATWVLWSKIIVACVPAGLVGVVLDDWLDAHVFAPPFDVYIIAGALVVYGIAFIIIERLRSKKPFAILTVDDIDYRTALFIGIFQVLSLIPGTSRSGSTILGSMLVGVSRTAAAEFSFFLAIPVMFGASLLKGGKYALDIASGETALVNSEIVCLAVATIVSFLVSIVAVKFLMGFVRRHSFEAFGWYRIALGIIVVIYFAWINNII